MGKFLKKKNVLLICGGGSNEHDISLKSALFFKEKLAQMDGVHAYYLCIERDGRRTNELGEDCELRKAGEIFNRKTQVTIPLDYVIPCIHGRPGENGNIQSVFDMMGLPYLGSGPEASQLCFNKVSTKLYLESKGIKTSPFKYFYKEEGNLKENILNAFFSFNKDVFIKASSEGSSVGCYHVTKQEDLLPSLEKAFTYGPYVLMEETIKGREIEVAAFNYKDELHITPPGEILCQDGFYTFEEKYSETSKAKTQTNAPLTSEQLITISEMARNAYQLLQIKDLARVDFFLSEKYGPLLNEINTFPGHTSISMFPMMMEAYGVKYNDFLSDRIYRS